MNRKGHTVGIPQTVILQSHQQKQPTTQPNLLQNVCSDLFAFDTVPRAHDLHLQSSFGAWGHVGLQLNENKLLITCNLVCCNTTVNCNNLASVANMLQSTQKFTLTAYIQKLIQLRENFRNSPTKNDALAAGQLQNGISADRCSTTLPLYRNATRIQTAGNQLSWVPNFKESCSHQQRLAQTGLSDFIN